MQRSNSRAPLLKGSRADISVFQGQSRTRMVSPHHQFISHFHTEMHRNLDKKPALSSFRSSWEMLMQWAWTRQHSWVLEFQAKVQALLWPTIQKPWASTLASRSPNFLTCKVEIIPPKHRIITGTKCLRWNLAHSRHSNLGANQNMSPPPQLAIRSNKLLILACINKLLPPSILCVI